MNLLITGGAGYIGSHMVKFARSRGHTVTVLDNLSTGFRDALPTGVLLEGSLLVPEDIRATLASSRFDGVIHFAGSIQVGESMRLPLKYYTENTIGTINLLAGCVEAEVKHVVFSSSAAVYGQPMVDVIDESCPTAPINPYGRTKLIGEQMLADCAVAHGLTSASLRYFNAAGADPAGELGERHDPETHLIPLLLQAASGRRKSFTINGDNFPTPDGTCVRDYVHVWDLCAAHLLAMDYLMAGGATTAFNLGSGAGFSVAEVLAAAKRITGIDFPVEWGPRREGDPARLVASRSKAERVLGWRCEYSQIETIIEHAWAWERKQTGLG
ncbi:MAG: UDP-glucose 4-epimerase GalE [Betaproteobacteria bacterium]|nr:UDP-glucose 4-epimerase GalE [Betaproteobacteria bacterium]